MHRATRRSRVFTCTTNAEKVHTTLPQKGYYTRKHAIDVGTLSITQKNLLTHPDISDAHNP
jgi:hypothetical protein